MWAIWITYRMVAFHSFKKWLGASKIENRQGGVTTRYELTADFTV